jgi:hypothetical protein
MVAFHHLELLKNPTTGSTFLKDCKSIWLLILLLTTKHCKIKYNVACIIVVKRKDHQTYPLPEYQKTHEGPPHNPHFSSTVTVNSISFTSPEPARTLKVSQDFAAMVAFHHLELLKNPTP